MSYLYKLRDLSSVVEVQSPKDVIKGTHYAVCVYETNSVYIEGDERSKTNPGHGYPSRNETFNSFKHYVTKNKTEWHKLIELLVEDNDVKDKFVAFEVSRVATVTTKVVVDVV